MNACILMGSPRPEGNTAALLKPFCGLLESADIQCRQFFLHNMQLQPCVACRSCQREMTGFGCPQRDDMQSIFDCVMDCQLIVLATPVYSWYCTPPMKSALDRLVYGMNKYYGDKKGPALWAGKKVALITTCGYPLEKGTDLLEEGIRRYCRHSQLDYIGMLAERHMGYCIPFMDEDKEERAKEFARQCILKTRKSFQGIS